MNLKLIKNIALNETLTVEILKLEENDDFRIIKLIGQLTSGNYLAFIKESTPVIRQMKYLIFDLSRLEYISSTGIGTFIPLNKYMKENNGLLIFIHISDKVSQVLSLLGFNQVFKVCENLSEAIILLKKHKKTLKQKDRFILTCPQCSEEFYAVASSWHRCNNCKELHQITADGTIKKDEQ